MVYFRLLLGSTRNTSKLQMRPRIICQEKDKEPDFNVSKGFIQLYESDLGLIVETNF
jgi:hypothetical protein